MKTKLNLLLIDNIAFTQKKAKVHNISQQNDPSNEYNNHTDRGNGVSQLLEDDQYHMSGRKQKICSDLNFIRKRGIKKEQLLGTSLM